MGRALYVHYLYFLPENSTDGEMEIQRGSWAPQSCTVIKWQKLDFTVGLDCLIQKLSV